MSNTLGNFIREVWLPEVQELTRNRLVARQITDFEMVGDGDTFHKPYHSDLSVGDYTRNATTSEGGAVTATDVNTTDESLTVDQCKFASFFVDVVDRKQMYVSIENKLKRRAVYKLRDTIDAAILGEYSNANLDVDWADINSEKSDGEPITLTTSNVLDVITKTKSKLEQNGAYNEDDYFLVVDTDHYYTILEKYMASNGYKIQDDTLKNGYRGKVLDMEVYTSNNVQTSTISNSTTHHWLAGKKGCITLKMQADAQVEVVNNPQNADGSTRLGDQYVIWNLYGYKTFTEGADELVDILIAD